MVTGDREEREAGGTRRPDASGEQVTQAELDTLKERLAQLEGSKRQEIVEAIKSCRAFVVIFSASANTSPHVRREVERAVSAERTIIPFRIEAVMPTGAMEYALASTHWLDATSAPLAPHIASLVATLGRLLGIMAVAAGVFLIRR